MKKMRCNQSTILFLKVMAAVLLFGMLPLKTHAETSYTIGVCVGGPEVFFLAHNVGFGLSSDPSVSRGRAAAKVDFSDVTIEKSFDVNSPGLLIDVANGTHWNQVSIVVYPGKVTIPPDQCDTPDADSIMTVILSNAVISLYATEADADRGVVESIAFTYGKICLGTRFGANMRCWDLVENTEK